jgi:hypothetical protein
MRRGTQEKQKQKRLHVSRKASIFSLVLLFLRSSAHLCVSAVKSLL